MSNFTPMSTKSIYDIAMDGIDGKRIDFSSFQGTKIMVVNVASYCGYTRQYTELQGLYEHFKGKLVVVGVPCNDFGGQEPGTEEDIMNECLLDYMVTFPVTKKVHIVTEDRHPLYQWLCDGRENGRSDFEVSWNFHKFLIDEEGRLVTMYPSAVNPGDERIIDWIRGENKLVVMQ